MKKYEKEEKIQITVILPSGDKKAFFFPNNISFSEMKKAVLSKFSLNSKSSIFGNFFLSPNDKINKLFYDKQQLIICYRFNLQNYWIFGKNVNEKNYIDR